MAFDVVVIGAGPSGLAAAARLGHFGVRVCVLEAHVRPGGLSSWHHVAGREVSSGLHALTNYSAGGRGGPLGKLLRQLRVKYSDLALRPQGESSVRFPGAALRFTNEPEFFREQVAGLFPGQIDGFDRFRALIQATDEGEITARQRSARAVAEEFITDPVLLDMLFCPVLFYGCPGGVGDGLDSAEREPDMDWLLFCVVWKCIYESGFGFPAGGMRPLWEGLVEKIRTDGGEVRLGSRVERLAVRGGRAAAAVLATGEEVEGDIFFSSAGAVETAALTREEDGGAGAASALPGSISIAEGIRLLDSPPAEFGLTDTVIFYSFAPRLRFRRPAGLVEGQNGVVCAPGNYRPFDGRENIVKVTQLASYPEWKALGPEEYAKAKRGAAVGMAGALAKLGVNLPSGERKWGAFDDVFTPLTLEKFTGHAEGALYGSPVKSRSGETGLGNLFLIGADQGFHGIVGAMLSGVAIANARVLSKRGSGVGREG